MSKAFLGSLSIACLLASCAAPPQAASPQAAAGSAASAGVTTASSTSNDDEWETVWVPPPVGSHLGGGAVRVPKRKIAGTDENALLGNIRRLNAAAGSAEERPYVVAAVSRVTGVTERELQAQQDLLQLRFGDLCAINAIARGNSNKVQEIASLKSKGRSWTDLAQANGTSVGTVVKVAQNANELTVSSYTNAAERKKGGQQKFKDLGRPQPNVPAGN
jgi:uncharacterized protein YerC